jgi:hypothetical protein
MSTTRTVVHKSLLAVILAYLRDGVTDTSNFGSYPSEQHIYTFSIGEDVWPITYIEAGQPPLSPGVTIEFISDTAEDSRAMPQRWIARLRFRIRVPWDFGGGSAAQDIAQKIDEAIHTVNGHIAIKDYGATPVTDTGTFLDMQDDTRGDWEQYGNALLTDLQLTMQARYTTPSL